MKSFRPAMFLFAILVSLLPWSASAASPVKEILVLHHSHLDVGFTHTQPMLWELQKDYIDQALAMLDATADWPAADQPRWTCEATAPVTAWLATASPAAAARFADYVKQGRIGISALAFNTTPLCSAEGLARQLYAARDLRARFGVPIDTANTHDVTGLPWTIVDELLDSGVELLIMGINLHLGGTPQPRPAVYRWRGPSGRELLVMNGEHYSMFDQWLNTSKNDLNVMAEGLNQYLANLAEKKYPYDFAYLTATCAPFAYDNSPPNADLPDLVRRWNAEGRAPAIRFVTPHELLERLRRVPREQLVEVRGDWTDYWNFGACSSAAETALTRRAAADLAVIDLLQAFQGAGRMPALLDPRLAGVTRRAWDALTLYNEHTWGAASALDPDNPNTVAQWYHKAAPAYECSSLSEYLLVRQLQRFAGNPPSMKKQEGVLVINPSSAPLRFAVPIPSLWRVPGKRIESGMMRGWETHRTPDRAQLCGPIELPPLSWQKIPLTQLQPIKTTGNIKSGKDFIESPFHRLTFNAESGRVTGLLDKKLGWQALDPQSPWGFFQLVHEKPDPAAEPSRKAFHVRDAVAERVGKTGWKPDWKAVRTGAKGVKFSIQKTPASVTLVLRGEAEGLTGLEQRVTLRADSPLIELEARFVKLDVRDPESLYFAFPLALPEGWRSHFDTAAIPTELDAEQIPGACRDWVTVDSFVSLEFGVRASARSADARGATLYCPDAPLVQVGDFNFGRKQDAIPRKANPLLLGWALNNYWETNFRATQPGPISLRYAFATHGAYDPARALAEGQQVANPPLVHPIESCPAAQSGKFLEIQNAHMVHIKTAEDGQGLIVRLLNPGSSPTAARLSAPHLQKAFLSTLLEQNKNPLALESGAIEIPLSSRQLTTVHVLTDSK